MATIATLKAEIADDLARSDLTTQISEAVSKAIIAYQRKRFYFNESREETFSTVAGQSVYTVSDDASIPLFYELDTVTLTNGGRVRKLSPIRMEEWELYNDNSMSSGEPYSYVLYNEKLYFYPEPNAAFTIRLTGHIKIAEPISTDTDSPWVNVAYDMIRFRAAADVAANKIRDLNLAQTNKAQADAEYQELRIETETRKRTGILMATDF